MGNGSRGTSSRAGSMLPPPPPPPRVPLMTPSASPPVQRPFGRRSDGPSPTKRSRMSRTPSLLTSGARGHSIGSTSSSSAPSPAFALDSHPEQGDDLQDARRLSMSRVLNVWSQLAGKYARRLDEDDIVDLEKETIIKDYGVLSSSDDMFEIGCFADLHEREERLDEEEQALQAVDDEPDEIDAFADTAENAARSETDGDGEDKWDFSRHLEPLPPVRELDPADAADLAEFLEAERARKDAFGDPDEDEDGSGKEEKGKDGGQGGGRDDGEEDTVGSRSGTEPSDIDNHSGVSEEEEVGEVYEESVLNEEDTNEHDHERVDYRRLSTPSGSPEFDILGEFSEDNEETNEVVAVSEHAEEDEESFLHVSAEDPLLPAPDDDSEDELGVWEQDEGNTLYSVDDFSDGLVEEDDDHDNAAERTPTPSPTPETSPRPSRMRGRGRPLKQVADVDQGIRASSKAASRTKASDPSTFAAAVGQLQTPPRSSSSFGPEPRNGKPITTYSRKRQGKTPLRKKTPFRITSTASEDSQTEDENVTPSVPLTSQQKQEEEGEFQSRFRRSSASPMKRFKLIPEVVIDVPPPAMSKEASDAETKPVIGFIDLSEDPDDFPPPKSAKAKGKAKAVDDQDHVMRREIRPMPSRLPVRPRPNRSFQDKPLESLSKSFHNNRKRRRSSSMQILEEYDEIGDQEDAPFYSPPPAPSSSRHPSFSQLAADEDNFRGERETGTSTKAASRHRYRSRPVGNGQSPDPKPRPSLEDMRSHSFSFSPPYPPAPESEDYPQHHPPIPLPNFQDPNAQYHLAQALRSLSVLMGGAFPFGSHTPHMSAAESPGHLHQPWPPYTPRHSSRHSDVQTPQSVVSNPPTSSPVGSDFSDNLPPSSPIKHKDYERGRSRSLSRGPSARRPKSAIRGSSMPSRSRSRSRRRVSFSSPEAIHIDEVAYDSESRSQMSGVRSSNTAADVDENHRNRGNALPHQRGNVRARTPAPPGPPGARLTYGESDYPGPSQDEVGRSTATGSRRDRARARTPGSTNNVHHVKRGKEAYR